MAKNAPLLTFDMKHLFLDRKAVVNRIGQQRQRVLSRQGAFVRSTARRSIRKVRKKTTHSKPGQPPKAHDPQGRFRKILYYYDSASDTVVVGLVFLRRVNQAIVGSVHEHGGTVYNVPIITQRKGHKLRGKGKKMFKERWKGKIKTRTTRKRTRVTIRYPKRSFMQPALAKEAPKFAAMWKNTIY